MNTTFPDFSNCNIVVVGDVMLDLYFWGKVERISPEAPVPVVRVQTKTRTLGGAGNVALNLTGLGCNTSLQGVRGGGPAGNNLSEILTETGIKDNLIVDHSHTTTTKTRVIGQGQQLLRLDEEQTWKCEDPIKEELIKLFRMELKNADSVILSDYGKGLLLNGIAEDLIRICNEENKPVFIDPKNYNWDRYKNATCITPNLKEFKQIASGPIKNDSDLEAEAVKVIEKFGLKYLLVTKGSQGMSLFSGNSSPIHIPTEAKDVFDVSGAGDTVISTLAASSGTGLSMSKAAELANLAAGIVVGKIGTQPVSNAELKSAFKGRNIGSSSKICSQSHASEIISIWRDEGNKIVFTNGCFDLLHTGHIKLLHNAAEKGDKLVIGLNSDSSVKRLKGDKRPILPEEERASLLSAIECVNMVVLFSEDTPLELIRLLKPEILVKGGDYKRETVVGHELVESWNGSVEIVPLVDGMSTTNIIESVKEKLK